MPNANAHFTADNLLHFRFVDRVAPTAPSAAGAQRLRQSWGELSPTPTVSRFRSASVIKITDRRKPKSPLD
jgi:hypothetical protein